MRNSNYLLTPNSMPMIEKRFKQLIVVVPLMMILGCNDARPVANKPTDHTTDSLAIEATLDSLLSHPPAEFVKQAPEPEPEPASQEDRWRAQWTTFRKNPDANSMKDVNMKLKVYIKFRDKLKAEIDGDMDYGIWIIPMTYDADDSPIKMTWSDAEEAGIYPSIAQGDWITVEGKFLNVADDGKLNVIPTKIINHGP